MHKTGLVQGGRSWTSGARRKVMNQTEIESPNIVFFHDSIYTVFGRLWPKKNAALGQEGSKQCFWAGNTLLHGIKCKCAKNQCICRKLAKTCSFMLDKRLPTSATLPSPNLLTKVKPNHISTTIFVDYRQRKSILVPAWCGHFYQHSAHSQQITDNVEEKEKIENGLDLVWRSGAFISVPSMHFTMFSYKLLNICCSPQKYQNTLTVHFRLFMRIPLLWLTSIVKY